MLLSYTPAPVHLSLPHPSMRLFTHNFLQCHVRNCGKDSFPLKIESEGVEVQVKAAEFNADFMAMQMCKIDYEALLKVLQEVRVKKTWIQDFDDT